MLWLSVLETRCRGARSAGREWRRHTMSNRCWCAVWRGSAFLGKSSSCVWRRYDEKHCPCRGHCSRATKWQRPNLFWRKGNGCGSLRSECRRESEIWKGKHARAPFCLASIDLPEHRNTLDNGKGFWEIFPSNHLHENDLPAMDDGSQGRSLQI